MFTGIIEEIGTIRTINRGAASAVLTIAAETVLKDVHLGDSIAVNGVCLTVTSFSKKQFTADVMHETLNRSSLGTLILLWFLWNRPVSTELSPLFFTPML